MKPLPFPFLLLALVLFACTSEYDRKTDPAAYSQEISAWDSLRITGLKSESGWLNLAGLYWLENGENTFGSDSSNQIVFPAQAPDFWGSVTLSPAGVRLDIPAPGREEAGEMPADHRMLKTDQTGDPDLVKHLPLEWFIIERNGKYAIRLRDLDHPHLGMLDSIERFPADLHWKKTARFHPYDTARRMMVPNVLGDLTEAEVPGYLEFRHQGRNYRLYPTGTADHLFLVFADETSARETYSGGRFLDAGKVRENNRVVLDFNKAYNPPCAFTPFATCPLPVRDNILPIRVTAGEKTPREFYRRSGMKSH